MKLAFFLPLLVLFIAPGASAAVLETVSISQYGADPTAANDSAPALNAALAASPSVSIPSGTYKFDSPITYSIPSNASVSIRGSSPETTQLFFPGGAGLTFNYGNQFSSVHLAEFSVTSGSATSTAAAITLAQTTANSGPALAAANSISNIVIRGSDGWAATNYFGTGIYVGNVSLINFNNLSCFSDAPSGFGNHGHTNCVILQGNDTGTPNTSTLWRSV